MLSTWVLNQKLGFLTPKASIVIGLSIIRTPFWGAIIFGSSQIVKDTSQKTLYI